VKETAERNGFQYKLWGNAEFNADTFPLTFEYAQTSLAKGQEKKTSRWAQVADLSRYELLHRFGGVYLDSLFEISDAFCNYIKERVTQFDLIVSSEDPCGLDCEGINKFKYIYIINLNYKIFCQRKSHIYRQPEEVDFEGSEEVDSNPQHNVPAEEHQPQPNTTFTWQNTGHSTYIKVEKHPTSKDEEANVDAEQLIEAISLPTPIFPSSLADIIALGHATRSIAWGAISIKIEDVELLMRRRLLEHEIFRQGIWAEHDDAKYNLYLAALLTNLFQIVDISKISPSIASIFKEFDFWKLQITGAQHLNRQIGPKASREKSQKT
jgi:hypothetical protein